MNRTILLFAEDPGGANYLAPLPAALTAAGFMPVFITAGHATAYLQERGVAVVPANADAPALLHHHHPTALVTGTSENPQTLGLKLVDAARAAGVPSLGVVDHPANPSYRFRGAAEPLSHLPDAVAVPDSTTAEAFVALGIDSARLTVCGHPHFDVVRTRLAALEQEDRSAVRSAAVPGAGSRRLLTFLAETSEGFEPGLFRRGPDYTLKGGASDNRTEVVLEEFLAALDRQPGPRPFLALRLHPKNRRDEFPTLSGRFDLVSKGGDPLPLIFASDLVVGMTSMLMLEAALLLRPTLAILPRRREAAWLTTIAAGITPVAFTAGEIDENLAETPLPRAELAARVDAVFPHDSIGRVMALLRRLLGP